MNPRIAAFNVLILERMATAGRGHEVAKADLLSHARSARPDLFDDAEPCYPNCKRHEHMWQHQFERSIYNLTKASPRKLRAADRRSGWYVLGP